MKQNIHTSQSRKVVVIGAGSVGATYCYALAQSGLADEIVLTDRNEDRSTSQLIGTQPAPVMA